ncbi:hypothetical protein ACFSPU_11045 [Haoranjiania flava]|uniref:Uncharacterized protein n=1 Tax=Haoranjiania flava TaxID=1856322 RepID=A0AAE3IL60_9BACT|nr:hypothetical protein [Haoranjiania flava]MCU7694252.1 hypothetical protein [Haoranjiania flava]
MSLSNKASRATAARDLQQLAGKKTFLYKGAGRSVAYQLDV